jgi:hypothetical protein
LVLRRPSERAAVTGKVKTVWAGLEFDSVIKVS